VSVYQRIGFRALESRQYWVSSMSASGTGPASESASGSGSGSGPAS
jgi:hypothetical protein